MLPGMARVRVEWSGLAVQYGMVGPRGAGMIRHTVTLHVWTVGLPVRCSSQASDSEYGAPHKRVTASTVLLTSE